MEFIFIIIWSIKIMQPFLVSRQALQLIEQYPEPNIIVMALKFMPEHELRSFIRLFLSEGIPFAFSKAPILFETVRDWLSKELDIHPKMITIIGSARLGYSLAPKKFGNPFGEHSDLDFTIISKDLFNRLKDDFLTWKVDYEEERVKPKNEKERKHWSDNYKEGQVNINNGFIDDWKIPRLQEYRTVRKVANVLYKLGEKLKSTQIAPKVAKASTRTYRDCEAFINQLLLNLSRLKTL